MPVWYFFLVSDPVYHCPACLRKPPPISTSTHATPPPLPHLLWSWVAEWRGGSSCSHDEHHVTHHSLDDSSHVTKTKPWSSSKSGIEQLPLFWCWLMLAARVLILHLSQLLSYRDLGSLCSQCVQSSVSSTQLFPTYVHNKVISRHRWICCFDNLSLWLCSMGIINIIVFEETMLTTLFLYHTLFLRLSEGFKDVALFSSAHSA